MPKIRGVKPDYWTDEDIVDLTIPARLLYIGLWNYACDNGHLQDKPKQIKMRIFPGDDVNCAELLRELEASGRIGRGDGWITVPNLGEHQKIDARYFTTCDKDDCEDPPEKVSQREARRAHAGTRRATDVRTPSARGDGDGDGEVMVKDGDRNTPAGKPAKRSTRLPDSWAPNDTHQRIAAEEGRDLAREITNFRDNAATNGRTAKDWDAAFRNWLRSPYGIRSVPSTQEPARLPHASELEAAPPGLTDDEYFEWEAAQRAKRRQA